MANPYKEKVVEDKKVKGYRIACAVFFFIEVIMTTFPFTYFILDDGTYIEKTAFEMFIQIGGYQSPEAIKLAIIASIFTLFPIVAFFFCILDKKSNWKYLVSAICCITCIALITFGIGESILIGALVTVFIYLLLMFLTACGFFNNARYNAEKNK